MRKITGAKYIFRIDDAAPNMAWEQFLKLKNIFLNHNIKPLLGVIPDNRDNELLKFPKCNFDFWAEINNLQLAGWDIAQHGYQHQYITSNSGLMKIANKSEFAGLPVEEQARKINQGQQILQRHHINPGIFMAPAHSFDSNTLTALKINKIYRISDGYGFFPYWDQGILFVPQLTAQPKTFPAGIFTFCLHPHTTSDENLRAMENFILKNKSNIISFSEALPYARKRKPGFIFPTLKYGAKLGRSLKAGVARVNNN